MDSQEQIKARGSSQGQALRAQLFDAERSPRLLARAVLIITILGFLGACMLLGGSALVITPSASDSPDIYSTAAFLCFTPGILALALGLGTLLLFLRQNVKPHGTPKGWAHLGVWLCLLFAAFFFLEAFEWMVKYGPGQPFQFQAESI